ncbi:FUSC family protein [Flavobacterium silvisoli]|uniref:FUSC family protein n=1 Tax=Flavobacterium silvisoli TaxID=2529433 RepID=A0A4Q9Z6R4_9FLAO|nr:FUSC family protein [Flavobacterium silvisoli]TBX70307.1 FUSC family protein [Flavobacterium silvisoli]
MKKKHSTEVIQSFFEIKETNRQWHLPIVAGLTVGIPLIFGWYIDNLQAGKLMSLAGLSILYIQSSVLAERMIILMTCCFGLMVSYTIGLFFSFNPVIAPMALGFLSFGVHYSLHKLNLTKPPGNFFFLMLASAAICTPFELENIPEKIGYLAIGTILTCGIGLLYSLITLKKTHEKESLPQPKTGYTNIVESLIFGLVMMLSLAVAFALKIEKPYWIPISCLAVMQGASRKHIWQRGTQRIIGTLIGLGITWLIASANPTPLSMVISITVLQIIVEFLVVRNYGIAVIFITILTIFLSESGGELSQNTNEVFIARLIDIIIGSLIGIVGGWVLFNEKIHFYITLQLRKLKIMIK